MHFYDALLNFTNQSLEPDENFEISTCSLQMSCSASELIRHIMVTCAGIEPTLQPWKGYVLTAWLTGQILWALLTCGGNRGIRTLDPLLAKQVLSQLSYIPMMADIVLLDEEFYDFLIVFGSGVDDFRQDLANRQQVHAPIGSFLGGFSKSASPNRTVELRGRLELPTYGLRYHCSTNWANQAR